MVWSGDADYKRRKQYYSLRCKAHWFLKAGTPIGATDVAADEGLPHRRGKRAPDFSFRSVEARTFPFLTTRARRY